MVDIERTLKFMAREDEERYAQAHAAQLRLPYINLVGYPIAPDVISLVPKEVAERVHLLAYLRAGNKVRVATDKPGPDVDAAIKDLEKATGFLFTLALCSNSSFRYAFTLYDVLAPEQPKEQQVRVTEEKEARFAEEIKSVADLKEKITKVSTTELLDLLFAGALGMRATDIHIEPQEKMFRVRFRIDGVLQDIAELAVEGYRPLINRIKFLAKMKLDRAQPQDGRFEFGIGEKRIDVRVSTLPTTYGEAVEMRILLEEAGFLELEHLGFPDAALKAIDEAIKKPHGMIINTGPTGSGKTTTLYAILRTLNKPGVKIITLEDPVEYKLEGIEQVQVDPEQGVDFPQALRGALRQDPDILMVGEIRDKETAEIALRAALTGHLVLTTLHANNAPASLARLVEMGIAPHLLAGSINLIIAQRLVRKVCQTCKGKGGPECQGGYRGRTAIIEWLKPSPAVEKLVLERAPIRAFVETAVQEGMVTMYEDGMQKVKEGITKKEEVERVTQEE